jgi:hypothetical protein
VGPGHSGGPAQALVSLPLSATSGSSVLSNVSEVTGISAATSGARGPPAIMAATRTPGLSMIFEANGPWALAAAALGSSSLLSGADVTGTPTPSAPIPDVPDGMLGATAGSSTGLYLAGFAVLLLLTAWALPRLARRLDEASALWRPMPFLSLLERPG